MRTKKNWRLPSCASARQGTPMGMVHSSITLVTALHAACYLLSTALSPSPWYRPAKILFTPEYILEAGRRTSIVYLSAVVPLSRSKAAGSHEECLWYGLLADPLR
jgi:hypothetical protein